MFFICISLSLLASSKTFTQVKVICSFFFFLRLSLFTVLVYQVPCGRLFPLFFPLCGGAPGYFPRPPTPTLSSPFFSFWTTQHEIQHNHPWEAHPAWDLNPADLAVVSTTLPSAPTRHTHTSMARRSSLPSKKSSPFGGIRTH
jgi:hypothetical protein